MLCTRCHSTHNEQTKYCLSCKEKERSRKRTPNKVKWAEASRRYRELHPERNKAACLAWARKYPEKDRARVARRRARKFKAYVQEVDPMTVWIRDKGICGVCSIPADIQNWHLDHVIPLSRGGEHSYANTQVTHPRCNLKKGTRIGK